jgi:hypothetical protein
MISIFKNIRLSGAQIHLHTIVQAVYTLTTFKTFEEIPLNTIIRYVYGNSGIKMSKLELLR